MSSKYQIVIPRAVREALGIHKGQIVSVIPIGGVIEVVPAEDLWRSKAHFPRYCWKTYARSRRGIGAAGDDRR